MARPSRCNSLGDDGRRSPAAEWEKVNDAVEQDDGSNGVEGGNGQGNGGRVHDQGNNGGLQTGECRGRVSEERGQRERNVRQNVGPPTLE